MRKLFTLIFTIVLSANSAFSQDLVLSDIIQQAREAQFQMAAREKIEQSMQPVKNEQNKSQTEQNNITEQTEKHPQE